MNFTMTITDLFVMSAPVANELTTRFPWEVDKPTLEGTVALLQKDMTYMVTHTAVLVHSNNAPLRMLVNTRRGQIVPRNECKFKDGTTLEFQDLGMPQINVSEMSVPELIELVWNKAQELGLELVT